MGSLRDERPGLNPQRLLRLMRQAIADCDLRLDGLVVLTEAASGSYVVTPIIASMSGAEVYAVTRSTRYGTVEEVIAATRSLAAFAGVDSRIRFVSTAADAIERADIVTNSGNVRPISPALISRMKPDAVISLMYESWEFREADLDLAACRQQGILVGGTNETHPAVDVFSYLGVMGLMLLLQAGIAVYRCRILLLCDNPFRPHLENSLRAAGACLETAAAVPQELVGEAFDAVVVALRPRDKSVLRPGDCARLAAHSPGAVLVQFWGDIDRTEVEGAGLSIVPPAAPSAGHMGILPSGPGPEAIVRLQAGGLKAGQVLRTRSYQSDPAQAAYIQLM